MQKSNKGTFKSGTSTKAISKAKEKLTRLQFLQWLDNYNDYIRSENRKIILATLTTFIMRKKVKVLATIMLKKTMFPRKKEKNTFKLKSKNTVVRKSKSGV